MSSKNIMFLGGANVDITGVPDDSFEEGDKNYGTVLVSEGGVARNIAANASLLGEDVKLITLICDDALSNTVTVSCIKYNIDISHSLLMANCRTPVYMSISDKQSNPKFSISDMKLYSKITPAFLKEKLPIINACALCVIDGNFSAQAIKYIAHNVEVPIFMEPTSTSHSVKFKDFICKFHTITPNLNEAEILSGIKISSKEDFEKARHYFINKGVKNVFITLGENGVYYADANTSGFIKHEVHDVKSSNGAGDAFMAGIVCSYIKKHEIKDTAKFAIATACASLQSYSAVNDKIDLNQINNMYKEIV